MYECVNGRMYMFIFDVVVVVVVMFELKYWLNSDLFRLIVVMRSSINRFIIHVLHSWTVKRSISYRSVSLIKIDIPELSIILNRSRLLDNNKYFINYYCLLMITYFIIIITWYLSFHDIFINYFIIPQILILYFNKGAPVV